MTISLSFPASKEAFREAQTGDASQGRRGEVSLRKLTELRTGRWGGPADLPWGRATETWGQLLGSGLS